MIFQAESEPWVQQNGRIACFVCFSEAGRQKGKCQKGRESILHDPFSEKYYIIKR